MNNKQISGLFRQLTIMEHEVQSLAPAQGSYKYRQPELNLISRLAGGCEMRDLALDLYLYKHFPETRLQKFSEQTLLQDLKDMIDDNYQENIFMDEHSGDKLAQEIMAYLKDDPYDPLSTHAECWLSTRHVILEKWIPQEP